MTLAPGHEQSLWRMAYNAERDGHDRAWHRVVARNHRDRAILEAAAKQAEVDQLNDELKHAEQSKIA